MPLGWYLAQGLLPLDEHSSDDEEGPCELPDGRLVCGPHGFVTCYKCCVDYSFMNEEDSSDQDDDSVGSDDDAEAEAKATDLNPATATATAAGSSSSSSSSSNSSNSMNTSSRANIEPPCPVFLPDFSHGDDDFIALRRGTGAVFPTKFVPPPSSSSASATPLEVFSGRRNYGSVTRFTLPNDPRTGLVLTDGACLGNGQPNPRAAWAFFDGTGPSGDPLVASLRLEQQGPFGDDAPQTSNRAELRAVIAALRFRFWPGEGFRTLVVATDSEYVVEGATSWVRSWVKNGWVTRAGGARGKNVKNKDLWVALLGEMERYKKGGGMAVMFWRIPREWNTVADTAAKDAAAEEEAEAPEEWVEVRGFC